MKWSRCDTTVSPDNVQQCMVARDIELPLILSWTNFGRRDGAGSNFWGKLRSSQCWINVKLTKLELLGNGDTTDGGGNKAADGRFHVKLIFKIGDLFVPEETTSCLVCQFIFQLSESEQYHVPRTQQRFIPDEKKNSAC